MRPIPILFLVFLLAACSDDQPPTGYDEPPVPTTPPARMYPAPEHVPLQRPPVRHAGPLAPVAPNGPSGSLTVARVGSYMDALELDLRRHVHGPGLVIARRGDVITLIIPNALLFTADGGVRGDDVLEPMGAVLRGYVHAGVRVNGYTDTTGTADRNIIVSQKHARSIADALAHEGVPPQRVTALGLGRAHLRVATGDHKTELRNRRIEVVLTPRMG